MRDLNKEEMLKYFEEINNRLASDGKHGEIIIAGGAALALVFNARSSTRDIDAIFHPAQDMRKIIESIAKDYDLPTDWLNDGVKGFITDKMKFEEHLVYTNLIVSNIDAEGLLAMKLTAARVDSKDMDDSVFLMKLLNIHSEEELFGIIERYTHPKQQSIAAKFFTIEAFTRYQKERKYNK